MELITCKNCGTKFKGVYCPNCGQKDNSGRIILKDSVNDVVANYFGFDAPIFRTIRGLITRPGALIRDFIFGQRKKYANPIRYFLFMLAIYLIVDSIIDFDPISTFGEILDAQEQPNPDTLSTKASNFFRDHINSFLFVFIFTLSLISKLFNLRSIYTLPEYIVLAFFTVGQYLFFSIFIILLTLISPAFFLLNYLIVFTYPVYVLVSFHEKRPFMSTIKHLFAVFIAWILYAFLGFIISLQIVKNFFL